MSAIGDWLPPDAHESTRPFAVYSDVADLSDEFRCRLFVVLCRRSDTAGGIVLAREETDDAPTVAAHLRDVLDERTDMLDRFGHPAPERSAMLRENLAAARRQLGRNAIVAYAVRYGKKVKRAVRPVQFPTPQMLASIGDSVTFGGHRWRLTQCEQELPAGPGRVVLALVAFDSRGRLCDALPAPSLSELDRWGGRNAREVARAALAHPDRALLDAFCARHGLEPMWCWRPIDREKAAA